MQHTLFPDALRAQYYLPQMIEQQRLFAQDLVGSGIVSSYETVTSIVNSVTEQIADSLDQILLPTIAQEINFAKNAGLLPGALPSERYQHFFIQNGSWTPMARGVRTKYPFLFVMLDTYLKTACRNIKTCLERYSKDESDITTVFGSGGFLRGISILGSDRHRGGQQALLLDFESGERVVYKPTNVEPEILLREFVSLLDLNPPYDLLVVEAIPKGDYGWIKYIPHISCKSHIGVENYYRRCGVLLAITDSLNYCDGHFENLIAFGSHPILIDCETLFHNFSEIDPEIGERSILNTGLIQKPPEEDSGQGFTAAFQTVGVGRYDYLHTHPINDRTDSLEVRFRGFSKDLAHSSPILDGSFRTPHRYIDAFIDGFDVAYDRISQKRGRISDHGGWWDRVEEVPVRQLIRHTMYYSLLLRKIQQPFGCMSEDNARETLAPLLEDPNKDLSCLVSYETQDILNQDIPFFYHHPGRCTLYDGSENHYQNYFDIPAVEKLREHLKVRSPEYKSRSLEILRNVLPASPKGQANLVY